MTVITCDCGGVYQRTAIRLRGDGDSLDCRLCHKPLETWPGPLIPVFTLVGRRTGHLQPRRHDAHV